MALQGRIVVFSVTGCPHCKAAKEKLNSLNLPYNDINLDDHPEKRALMTELTNKRTVPQIFFNEKHVGGNDDFQKLTQQELDQLVAYVKNNPAPAQAPQPVEAKSKTNDSDALTKKDESAALVEELIMNSDIIKSHRYNLFLSHSNSFTGSDLIEFIATSRNVDKDAALGMARSLVDKKFVVPIKFGDVMKDDSSLFRLTQDSSSKALNTGLPALKAITAASELSSLVRRTILQLYNKFLSADGKMVDYKGIGESKEFGDYVALSAQLQRVEIASLSREEKLAFFINIYNALVIHANIKLGFPRSTWQRYKFFNNAKYIIGGHEFSLQDIENGMLRSNRKGVGMFTRPFSKSDPRLKLIVEPNEPLIHFALVCGAKSCPPIKTYSAENIMRELNLAAAAFLESDDGCCVNRATRCVELSMIFKWYMEDFGSNNRELLKFVEDHMDSGEKKTALTELMKQQPKVYFMYYNWGTNGKQ